MKVGPSELRDFWYGFFHDYPGRRKRLVLQWFNQSMQEKIKMNSLSEQLYHFIDTLLFSPFSFELHHDHCSFIHGYRIPYTLMIKEERAFLVHCYAYRDELWKKISTGKNGEFSLSHCTYNLKQDCIWQRQLVRDFCWSIKEQRHVDLLIALQSLLKSKPDVFLLAVMEAIQSENLARLPCWGFHFYDRHPEEIKNWSV